ncbi:hypothetical protein F5Y10DRAFT_264276 [Nemania abortiva]|nr:hypothetical protein F5Y10DRAFT_264276 [Nemania abortiva]
MQALPLESSYFYPPCDTVHTNGHPFHTSRLSQAEENLDYDTFFKKNESNDASSSRHRPPYENPFALTSLFRIITMEKQTEVVNKKREKVHELRRKVEVQEGVVQTQTGEVQALGRQKQHLTRQLGLLEVRYEESLSSLERHEERLARSGRPGANGSFERNMRREVDSRKEECKDVADQIKALEKDIKKAEKSERKAQEKLDELQNKLSEANLQLRNEQGRLLQLRYRD